MPINYIQQSIYTLNYNQIYNTLNKNKIFSSVKTQKHYLNIWIKLMKVEDKEICKNYQKYLYHSFNNLDNEVFQQSHDIDSNNTVLYHFNISSILSNLPPYPTQQIPIKEFIDTNSCIYWTEPIEKHQTNNTIPVLLIPYLAGTYYRFLVIDGNHRIYNMIQSNMKFVPAHILSIHSVIHSDLMLNNFEKVFYMFQNEIVNFANEKYFNGAKDTDLLNQSFIRHRL